MSLHAERAKCFSSTKATPFPSQILKKIVFIFYLMQSVHCQRNQTNNPLYTKNQPTHYITNIYPFKDKLKKIVDKEKLAE